MIIIIIDTQATKSRDVSSISLPTKTKAKHKVTFFLSLQTSDNWQARKERVYCLLSLVFIAVKL